MVFVLILLHHPLLFAYIRTFVIFALILPFSLLRPRGVGKDPDALRASLGIDWLSTQPITFIPLKGFGFALALAPYNRPTNPTLPENIAPCLIDIIIHIFQIRIY
jgi:hypothetical protein